MKRKRLWALGLAALLLMQSSLAVLAEELPIEEIVTEETVDEEIADGEISEVEIETVEENIEESAPEEVVDEDVQSAEAVSDSFQKKIVTISKAETWGYQGAKVTWKEVSGADGYRLYVKPAGDKWEYVKQLQDTSYVQTGLITGKEYTYFVRAYRKIDGQVVWTKYSEGKSVTPIPRKTTITKIEDHVKSAKLNWTKTNGASGYRVYYRLHGTTSWTRVAQVSGGSTLSYTHKNLKPGKCYDYIMRAYRTVNGKPVFSKYSNVMSVTIPTTTIYEMESESYYTDYDVTGDGVKDEFYYEFDRETGYADVYVNGEYECTFFKARGGSIYLVTFSSSEVFLLSLIGQYGGNSFEAFRYKNGGFQVVNTMNYFDDRLFESSMVWKAYDEWLYIVSTVQKTWNLDSFAESETAPIVNSRFKLKDGKFILSARTLTVIECDTYTALNSFSTSTSRTSLNSSGPYVRAGQTVTVKKVYLSAGGKAPYYQISVNGKTGWIQDSSAKLLYAEAED